MACIQLTKGYVAIVDDEDFERINAHSWYAVVGSQVRAARTVHRKMRYMHYEVLRLDPVAGIEIDHDDRDPLNYRKANLKVVTHTQNMQNTLKHKERVGVCFNRRAALWSCYLDEPNKKRKYLGYTKTREEGLIRVEAVRANLS